MRLGVSRWQVDGGHDIEQTNLPSGGKDSGYIQMRSQEPWMKVLGLASPTPAKSQGLESAWPVSELPITRQCGRASLLCVDEGLRPTRRKLRQQSLPGRVGVRSCSWLLEAMMHAAKQRSAMFLALLSCRIAMARVYTPRTTTKHCRARPALRWLHLSKSVSCVRRDIASEGKRKSVAAMPWAVRCRGCRHESISRST